MPDESDPAACDGGSGGNAFDQPDEATERLMAFVPAAG
jgi:hypothetical protein